MAHIDRIALAALVCCAAASSLSAQSNAAEVFGGYSYTKADPETPLPRQSMNGWVTSAAGYPRPWIGVGFEISGSFGTIPAPSGVSAPGLPFKEYSYLAGPQFRFVNKDRVQANFKLMVGGVFGQVNIATSATPVQVSQLGSAGYLGFNGTKFAALFALPVDVSVTKAIGIRVEPGLYLTNFNKSGQGNFRISVGPVFRFGHHE